MPSTIGREKRESKQQQEAGGVTSNEGELPLPSSSTSLTSWQEEFRSVFPNVNISFSKGTLVHETAKIMVLQSRPLTPPSHEEKLVASFPGSSAPEQEIEFMHVERVWYYFSRENPQRQKGGRKTLIACGRTQGLRTGKRAKVAGNLLHIYSYWGANILHTEH